MGEKRAKSPLSQKGVAAIAAGGFFIFWRFGIPRHCVTPPLRGFRR